MNIEDNNDGSEFCIPSELVEKIYDLSGGVDKYKGVIMAVSSESGRPLIYCKFDCGMTEFALTKSLENHLASAQDPRENDL